MDEYLDKLLKENNSAFYVFDIAKLKKRIAYIRSRLPQEISLCYAVKANTFIVKEIVEEVERFEICSPGEAEICSQLGIPEHKTVVSGVYKTPEVMDCLVASSACDRIYTVESITQFQLFRELSDKHQRTLPILLRLTNDSQFGINEMEIEDIIAHHAEYKNLKVLGLQYFSGTQKTSLKKYKREIEHLDNFLCKLRDDYGYKADELEYGPGFPASYFVSDTINEEEVFDGFLELIQSMSCKVKVTLELGRSIAASCGRYFTHIVDIKLNKGQNYILVDGGMHHIVYFGQYMGMKQPILDVWGKESNLYTKTWNICGSLCSMNDIIAKQVALPDVEIGDVICFDNTGAYCMTEGISLFLSRDLPAVYLLEENGNIICVRKSFETMKLNMPNY